MIELERNVGGNAARNHGIRTAQAELITFLDSDDEYLPNRLGSTVRYFTGHPEVDLLVDACIKRWPDSPGKRDLALEAMKESERALRLWLRGQLIAMLVVGLLTGLGLWALGMPSALTLGLLAGLLEFIPFAGPILAAIPAVLLALAVSPDLAFWVVVVYFAVQQFEGYVLTPLVQQYAVDLPGVVLLFSLLAFGILFGTLGVILAAPLAVVSYVLVKRLYVIEALHTPTPIPGDTGD